MRTKRLERQLKKSFGPDIEDRIGEASHYLEQLDNCEPKETLISLCRGFGEFISSVDENYVQLTDKASLAERSLEVSSKELTETNRDLFQLNQTFDAMINSLGQGFFLFSPNGTCHALCSKASETLLQGSPAGRDVADVLGIAESERETFRDWYGMLFQDMFDFSDLSKVGPKNYPHSEGLMITLEYRPLRNRREEIDYIVVVATDRTAEFKAKEEARRMHSFATFVVQLFKDKQRFGRFVAISREIVKESHVLVSAPLNEKDFLTVKRNLHTLKGGFATFGFDELKDYIHEAETRLSNTFDKGELRAYLTTALRELDQIFEHKLFEYRDIIDDALKSSEPSREIPLSVLHMLNDMLAGLGPIVTTFQDHFVKQLLVVPLRKVFSQYNSVLKDAGEVTGKEVSPIMFEGEDLGIIPEKYENLLASFIHIFRNIVDHGFEKPHVRVNMGKPARGNVTVRFATYNSGKDLEITIQDDGAGINVQNLRQKLKNRPGIDQFTDDQVMDLIFEPGLSTAEKVTEISGRGVGLDAVRAEVEKLGGTIIVKSEFGKGATFRIRIPKALARDVRMPRAA